jgi:hypothetical protein
MLRRIRKASFQGSHYAIALSGAIEVRLRLLQFVALFDCPIMLCGCPKAPPSDLLILILRATSNNTPQVSDLQFFGCRRSIRPQP